MAKLYNLAKETTATSGTAGTLTLGGAVTGFRTFAGAGAQDGDEISYGIWDGTASEAGRGVYGTAGTTLTRGTVLMSTAGAGTAIDLSGSAHVFITALAEDIGLDFVGDYAFSNPPREAELEAAFDTAENVGAGYCVLTQDQEDTPNTYLGISDGVSWFLYKLSRAISTTDGIGAFANLEYWFDAQTISGLDNGDPVSQWNDLSGNNRHLAQGTGASQPLYITDGLNGLPCVRFDGSNDVLLATGISLTNLTVFAVIFVRDQTTDNDGFLSIAKTGGTDYNSTDGMVILSNTATNNMFGIYRYNHDFDLFPIEYASPQLITIRLNSGDAMGHNNGASEATDIYSYVSAMNANILAVGSRITSGNPANYGNADIAEIGIYSSAMSDEDIADLEAYLMAKWGIT